MDNPYFIMLYHQTGNIAFPITDEGHNVMFYNSEDEATESMNGHAYAEAFGFEIHCMSGCVIIE